MKRNVRHFVVGVAIVCMLASGILASASGISVSINGTPSSLGAPAILLNENIMLPVREFGEMLKYKVTWNSDCSVTLLRVDNEAKIYIDANTVDINGTVHTLPCNVVLKSSKTYAPLALFELLDDMSRYWDYDENVLDVKSDSFISADGLYAVYDPTLKMGKESFIVDFEDDSYVIAKALSSYPDNEDFVGLSVFDSGVYYSGEIATVDGRQALKTWNATVKVSDQFTGVTKPGKYKLRFKACPLQDKSGDKLQIAITNIPASVKDNTPVQTYVTVMKAEGSKWEEFEYIYNYSGTAAKLGDGYDADAFAFRFFTSGAMFAIDDIEITPVQ